METKFSQGKWQIQYLGKMPKVANEDILIADVNGETQTEVIYNAKLIAAAPDLLEALNEVAEQLEVFSDMNVTNRERVRAAIQKAKAAIKKATT